MPLHARGTTVICKGGFGELGCGIFIRPVSLYDVVSMPKGKT